MYHHFGQTTDKFGNGLQGWQVEVFDGSDVVPICSDAVGTPLPNSRAVSDAQGNLDLYVSPGTYQLRYYDPAGTLRRTEQNVVLATTNLADYNTTFTGAGQTPPAMNVYAVSDTGRRARQLFRPAERGAHVGEQFSFIGTEARTTGSGANGPQNACMGDTVSIIKVGNGVGEINGRNTIVRQDGAGSDACGHLYDVASRYGWTGFAGAIEARTALLDVGGNPTHSVRTQIGIIDTVNNSSFGFFITPDAAADVGHGLLMIQQPGKGVLTNAITVQRSGRTAFQVSGNGEVYANAGALGSAQYAKSTPLLVEAETANSMALRCEFNRYAAGTEWTTAEARMRMSVDGALSAASNPWVAYRGETGSVSSVVVGFGDGLGSFDRVRFGVDGSVILYNLPDRVYADDAAANAAGLGRGGLYHTGDGVVRVKRT